MGSTGVGCQQSAGIKKFERTEYRIIIKDVKIWELRIGSVLQ